MIKNEFLSSYNLEFNPITEMRVSIWYLEWEWNSARFWITLEAPSQELEDTEYWYRENISFIVTWEREMNVMLSWFEKSIKQARAAMKWKYNTFW